MRRRSVARSGLPTCILLRPPQPALGTPLHPVCTPTHRLSFGSAATISSAPQALPLPPRPFPRPPRRLCASCPCRGRSWHSPGPLQQPHQPPQSPIIQVASWAQYAQSTCTHHTHAAQVWRHQSRRPGAKQDGRQRHMAKPCLRPRVLLLPAVTTLRTFTRLWPVLRIALKCNNTKQHCTFYSFGSAGVTSQSRAPHKRQLHRPRLL